MVFDRYSCRWDVLWTTINSFKELSDAIDKLKKDNEHLKAENEDLIAQIQTLNALKARIEALGKPVENR
jgi:cell division protein FtsB